MSVEFSVSCVACGGQFFQSNSPSDRCENCEYCFGCERTMPRAERRAGDVFCSLECEFEYSEREANEAAKRRATSAITKAYRTRARALLFERDDWTCYLCGVAVDRADVWPSPGSAVLDHVIPRAKLGLTHPSNLKTAHAACNNQKKDMDLDVYLALVAGPLRRPSLIS